MACSPVSIISLTLFSYLVTLSCAQSPCGTDQNPYCAGNDLFEQLCCTYPNVCYWANRDGQPACCPYGQVCDGVAPYSTRTTFVNPTTTVRPTTTTTVPPASTVTSYVGGGGVVIVTSPNAPATITTATSDGCHGGVCSTVTSVVGGAYSTVTSGVVGIYSTVTSGVGGVVSTVTSEIGQAYSTVSGVLVGNDAVKTPTVTVLLPVMAALFTIAWNRFG